MKYILSTQYPLFVLPGPLLSCDFDPNSNASNRTLNIQSSKSDPFAWKLKDEDTLHMK